MIININKYLILILITYYITKHITKKLKIIIKLLTSKKSQEKKLPFKQVNFLTQVRCK